MCPKENTVIENPMEMKPEYPSDLCAIYKYSVVVQRSKIDHLFDLRCVRSTC